ncbi:HdaA/DnaA family protein [Sphingomonas sp. ASY06-1R]|uniref:HdaA/DnaA family protein n=1 Tax=Sphingomonas sp. ASY06-1R TaxID=3445771 RepID=UPI003FA212F6
MSQIALPLDWPAGNTEQDYLVSPANRPLIRHFEHWSLWPVMATILAGPRKSGRSLLGRIYALKSGGELIDNAETADEEAVFHAWNRAQEQRRPLILIADAPPPAWEVTLPDLRSRLAATPVVRIEEPDDALAGQLIEKLCHIRGLAAPPELVRYLVPRIERSYLGVHRTIDALDELAYAQRQRLTVPLARKALGFLDEG